MRGLFNFLRGEKGGSLHSCLSSQMKIGRAAPIKETYYWSWILNSTIDALTSQSSENDDAQ